MYNVQKSLEVVRWPGRWMNEKRDRLYDVGMSQFFEETDFAYRSAGNAFILSFQPDLLQSNDMVRFCVFRLVHHAVRAYRPLV